MKWILPAAAAVILSVSLFTIPAAHAASPVPVTFGTTWDGPGQDLQSVVDAYLGAPGLINVQTDYVGAHAGDLDGWFWVGSSFPMLMITEIASNANTNGLGWYAENYSHPVIDGVQDGVVFTGDQSAGASTIVTFPSGLTHFGFYLDTHTMIQPPTGEEDQVFFTNRFYNDLGPSGMGATHAPLDGDVQALVFDVSQWKGVNTWLVCFEDSDSGAMVGDCCTGTDNDFNDLVFQVNAYGATPTQKISFGALKARSR